MQENKEAERNRITYLIWIIVTMILGLSSRKFGPYLPVFVRHIMDANNAEVTI